MDKRDAIDFNTENISGLYRKLLIPTLLGTLSMCAMTAIDGIFVGHGVGAEGVAAVNIIAPVFQIMSGLGLMIGAGCSVVVSIQLSRQKEKVARLNVTQALVFATLVTAIICAVAMLAPDASCRILGSSETLLPMAHDYLFWLMPGFLLEMWAMIGLFVMRLDGAPQLAMWCNIIAAIVNAVLDWVFIFPMDMGVKGAAIATSTSMTVCGLIVFWYLGFRARTLRLIKLKMSRTSMLLALRNIGYHCRVGSASMLGELTLAVLIFMGNMMFMRYLGDDGVAAFGIACYYTPFFFNIGNAVAQSAQPIISYNYGALRWDRIIRARRLLISTALLIGMVVMSLFAFTPTALVSLFVDPTTAAAGLAVDGFPWFATGVPFFILNVALVGYYQSIERTVESTVFVFLRGVGLLIPAFLLLPIALGPTGIWLAMPAAEVLTLAVIASVAIVQRRRRKA